MTSLIVGIGECRFASNPDYRLLSYALGSCLGVAAWDPVTKTGGLLHCMLPDSGMNIVRASGNPGLFTDTGLKILLNGCEGMGACRGRLILHAVGAARMLDNSSHFDVGNRNIASLRCALIREKLRLSAELLGGNCSRSIALELATGLVSVREGGKPWRELPANKRSGGLKS